MNLLLLSFIWSFKQYFKKIGFIDVVLYKLLVLLPFTHLKNIEDFSIHEKINCLTIFLIKGYAQNSKNILAILIWKIFKTTVLSRIQFL
jgi:hypothetical protein